MLDKFKKWLKFLFPINLTCNICGREIFSGEYFCEDCEKQLPKNQGVICNHCGRKVLNSEEYCNSCKGRETHFEMARSVFCYDGQVKWLIHQLKYGGKRYLAEIFAKRMANLYITNYFNCDFAVCVPMSSERLKRRKYNQAELLAENLCKIIGLEHKKNIVIKAVETERQTGLNAIQRKNNLRGTFKLVDKKQVKGKRVLIIDDVMTTGATVECVAEVLKKGGAEGVMVLTAASVYHDGEQN